VHHLFFSDSDYEERGTFIKCNPAIKSKEDRDAIVQAVNEDRIDVIATDHAPHTLEEKRNKYLRAPSGMPLAQDSLVSLFDKVNSGIFAVEKVVEKTSHAPAKLYEVSERGFLREGYYADLVLISPSNKKSDREIFSKCGWSPFSGHHFANEVSATWVNGHLRYENGKMRSGPCGKAMEYKR
jgi:dihydroorotase